jgi:tetratricopeptide (TPR) repeat protein
MNGIHYTQSSTIRAGGLLLSMFFAAAMPANTLKAANAETNLIQICGDASVPSNRRFAVCTRLIRLGRLDHEQLSTAYSNRGAALGIMGKENRALADFNASVRTDPDNGISRYDRGALRYRQGKFDLAIEDFNDSIRLEPDFALARMARAVAFLATKDVEKALNDADEMVRRFPDSGIALETRAHILKTIGRRDDAIADYRKALEVEPDNLELTSEIESTLRKLGVAP